MDTNTQQLDGSVGSYTQLYSELPTTDENELLRQARRQALNSLNEVGFPDRNNEAWKYTNVHSLLKMRFSPAPSPRQTLVLESEHAAPMYEHHLVLINGYFSRAHSNLPNETTGLRVTDLFDYLKVSRDKKNILSALEQVHDGFEALNTLFLNGGVVIEVDDNCEITAPLEIIHLTGEQEQAVMANPYTLILLGDKSRCTIVERFVGLNTSRYLENPVNQILLGDGAQLKHVRLKQASGQGFYIGHNHVGLARHSQYHSCSYTFGGLLSRDELGIEFNQPHASVTLQGLSSLHASQHADTHILVDHKVGDSVSRQSFHNILSQRARTVFSGRVVIHPDAQHSDASQNCRSLLLSSKAEADSRPQLEIYADNVKCSHGATTGYLDPDALFYLCSRGIPQPQARQLLVEAFAQQQLAAITDLPVLEKYIGGLMKQQLAER